MEIKASATSLILILVVAMCAVSSEKAPTTGREFRKLRPELRARHLRSPISRIRQVERRRGMSIFRRTSPFRTITSGRKYPKFLLKHHTSVTRRNGAKTRRKTPRFSRPSTSSLGRQYRFNTCKSIKNRKCCHGWTKHFLTGYCMPSCRKSCVHGTCLNDYVCACNPGFEGALCNLDKNECSKNVCEQGCLNTYGSYRCLCNEGSRLRGDGSCESVHPCVAKKCQHKCYLDGKEEKCICPKGYKITDHGRSCSDVNECTERDVKCGSKDRFRTCKNLPGSYVCTCLPGYLYDRYDRKCHDLNECLIGTHDCNTNATRCVNTAGSFRCECRDKNIEGVSCVAPEEDDVEGKGDEEQGAKGEEQEGSLDCPDDARLVFPESGESWCEYRL